MENIRIPLHHVHEALGAKIIPFGGFEMPVDTVQIKKNIYPSEMG